MSCRKSESKLGLPDEQSWAFAYPRPQAPCPPGAAATEKPRQKISALCPRNPLKSLNSDERESKEIQQSFHVGFRAKQPRAKKTQTDRPDERRAPRSRPRSSPAPSVPRRKGRCSLHLPRPPRDQPRAALVAGVDPQPVDGDAESVADADQKVDVGETPRPTRPARL